MSLLTPRNDVRRLTFTPGSGRNPFSNPAPSPYTPFSGRKSGSASFATPRMSDLQTEDSLPPEPSAEAQRYVDGDLVTVLRGAAIDTITASRKLNGVSDPVEKALGFVSQLISTLNTQLDISDALAQAPSQRPFIRDQLHAINSQLRLERDTWILLQTVWRHPEMPTDDLSTRRLAPDSLHAETIRRSPGYLKLQHIVEWLERTADSALQRSGGPHLKPLDDPAYRWEYTATRHRKNEPISMDAPCKGAVLDEVEQKAEARLSREVYRLIRAGRLDEAEEVCRLVGQPWRAAAIAGGKRGSAMAANGVSGLARKTWRIAAVAVATSKSNALTPHERAVCGVLAGVLEPVLAVAETYDDELWARTSLLLEQASQNVLSGSTTGLNIEDAAILEAFRECRDPAKGMKEVRADLLDRMRKVQSYVALGENIGAEDLKMFLESLADLSEAGLNTGSEWASRFAAQICLFLKFSGLMSAGDLCPEMFERFDVSVQTYVRLVLKKDLDEEGKAARQKAVLPARPLVPAVAAHFLSEISDGLRTVETYSGLLCAALRADLSHEQAEAERAGVETREIEERRVLCFRKACNCFTEEMLDAISIAAVDSIWETTMPRPTAEMAASAEVWQESMMEDDFTAQDELAMRAVEFLLFPDHALYEEALYRITRMARRYFLLGKRQAARNVIAWFPKKALEHIRPEVHAKTIHEFDCWNAYHNALKKHGEWSVFQATKRPRPLPDAVRAAALAQPGQVSYDDQASAKLTLEEHLTEVEEYNRVRENYRNAAIESLRGVLLFSGGWMQDIEDELDADDAMVIDQEGTERKSQVAAVRNFGVPQMAMLLHHVYDESQLYGDAVELATLIADEESQLYSSFGAPDLKAFLSRVADSAVHLANSSVQQGVTARPYEGTFFEEFV